MFDRVKDEISWDEGVDISPKYLGDDMVLLLSLTDARAEQMGKEETMNDHPCSTRWRSGTRGCELAIG